jgi:hypothetical protein
MATSLWFFAAERTMVGPPISMFSTASSSEHPSRDGLGKRIEVNDHHIDRRDTVLLHDAVILTATAEDAAVYFRMQGLHASIHHFRETGVVRDFGTGRPLSASRRSGAAGGQQLDTTSGKRLREFDDTGLVRNTEQSAADWTTLLHGIKSPGFEHYRER